VENHPFTPLLDPDEVLLWSGQPRQGIFLQASDIFLIPFSLVWGGFAIFWEITALGIFSVANHHPNSSPIGYVFPLFGIPFVLVGLYFIFGRFFFDAAQRRGTWYGITNRRLIISKSSFNSSVNSLDFLTLTNLNLVERKDNSGDVVFGTPVSTIFANSSWPGSRRYPLPLGFYLVPQARRIYNLVREAQQAALKK